MAMRVVPHPAHSKSFTHADPSTSAPSAPGVYDTLRAGVGPSPPTSNSTPTSRHPLEARLRAWEATQEAVRMESLRKTFGIAEPLRRGMELKIAREGEWRPQALNGGTGVAAPGVHEDILTGKDAEVQWEDVFTGQGELRGNVPGVHEEMERKLKI
ncbi:proteasome maturation factor UMP1 [Xylariaceae sp. FL0662B]|nr:proteasome maturation factor UMP1 [Xylariaceae sp. FL0662B]